MKNQNDLKRELTKIDGKGYKAYKDLEGQYDFKDYILSIDHVQGDPFAAPSRVRVIVSQKVANIPMELFDKNYKKIAVQDFLTRLFYKNINVFGGKIFGSGKSGLILISRCPQEILDRTSIIVNKEFVEARIEVGFPARGRSVLSKELEKILYDFLPKIVENSLIYKNINKNLLISQVKLVEDQEYIREELKKQGLVAFIANGSILPRESGVSTKPLKDGIKFLSPKTLEIEMNVPNQGKIKGMTIKKGITVIVGGGYHGKSTLLKAIELGVYNHILGDGREFVITDNTALKVRAEDGRVIHKDDISLFIDNLPNGKNTKKFSSENASGSTSQAANIIEGIECGAKTLLIDEDTSATNFMIRDEVMQKLVSNDKEPITPFIEVVRDLYTQKDISTIIVVGSSGDYFDIADTVIQMDCYEPKDVTNKAKEFSTGNILKRIENRNRKINIDFQRIIKKGSIERSPKGVKIKTLGLDSLSINKDNIDLRAVEQLVDSEQVKAIGDIITFIDYNLLDEKTNLAGTVKRVVEYINKNGLIKVNNIKGGSGNLAMPRPEEIACAINRYRKLKI